MGTQPLPKRGRRPQFSAHVYCGQTAACIKMPVGMEVSVGPDDIVLWGPSSPAQKGGGARSPIFAPFLLWPNGWMHQNATWYGVRPQPRGLCVTCEPSPRSPKKGGVPPISAHVYCGQITGCMKTPLGKEVDLGPGHIVLDGVPALR